MGRVGDWAEEVAGTSAQEFAGANPHPFLVQERSAPRPDGRRDSWWA